MSGRSCSAAYVVFFERDLPALEEARQRGDAEDMPIRRERYLQLLQCAVGPRHNQSEDTFGLRFDRLRASIAALRPRRHPAGFARLRHPADRARHAHLKVGLQPLDATCRPQQRRPHAYEDRPKEMLPCLPASFASRQFESELA